MKKYTAEFIGTFVLVFAGVGSAVLAYDKINNLGVGLAFGLALLAMAYTIGPISGCHINPAVTLGLIMSKKLPARDAGGYMVGQVLGAIVAAGLVLVIAQGKAGGYDAATAGFAANGYGAHSPGGYSVLAAFLTETILTFFLVLTVLGSTDIKAPAGFAGLPIGLVLVVIHLVGIPVTNLSVNPARSIATAVFVGGWALAQVWLFILAPLVGGVLASVIYGALRAPDTLISARQSETALGSEQQERR